MRLRGGGQPGNRNALKTGAHTRAARGLRKQIAVARKRMKLLIAYAKEEMTLLPAARQARGVRRP